mmetsp:Transcript_13646/g.22355  ORF Transcript_13646/g.22355 Transcript_13646/m.22355 type:complete len:534 (+) Transcript_13646:166-1767(+)
MASIISRTFTWTLLLLLLCHVLPVASKSRSDAYDMLAASIRRNGLSEYDVKTISSALKGLSTTQAALKRIDGTAHEMYQRTHKSSTTLDGDDDDDEDSSGKIGGLKVKGRMSRNAARVGCVADALFAAELCELATSPSSQNEDGTLAHWTEREIVFNATIYPDESTEDEQSNVALSVLVIYEPNYNGGAGVRHGGIEDLLSFTQEEADDDSDSAQSNPSTQSTSSQRGRFIIILSDHDASSSKTDLPYIISTLDIPPIRVKLNRQSNKMASVNDPLYRLAGTLIRSVGQVIDLSDKKDTTEVDKEVSDNESESGPEVTNDAQKHSSDRPAIHIVGHSLAGAVGALSANILDGSLPMPAAEGTSEKRWSGFARDRVSALCLGCPPCMSGIEVDFVTSIINGDDVVCRSSYKTLQRLYGRTERSIKGGILGKGVGLMSDAARLTVTGLTSGSSKKQDAHLAVPGRVYLIRPRRLGGGSSSIHEVGGSISGRENFRAAVLWQLNDVLLSKSLWKHHSQSSYIRSLDRVQLKGFSDA